MKSRRSRLSAGVEPRFCATHLVRNPLQGPSSQALLSIAGSPPPEHAPASSPAPPPAPDATDACANCTAAAWRSPSPAPTEHDGNSTSEPPQLASPPTSTPDTFAASLCLHSMKMGLSCSVSV